MSKKKVTSESLPSSLILTSLQENYKQLSKTLPGDIAKLEKEITEEDAAHAAKMLGKRQLLEQLKQTMKGLPEMWSLDKEKNDSQKATDLMHLGQRMRDVRVQKGWSQETLGKKVGKSQAEISRMERMGKVSDEDATKMAEVFKMTKKQFLSSPVVN